MSTMDKVKGFKDKQKDQTGKRYQKMKNLIFMVRRQKKKDCIIHTECTTD